MRVTDGQYRRCHKGALIVPTKIVFRGALVLTSLRTSRRQIAIKRSEKSPALNKLARMAKKSRKLEIRNESSNPSDSSADEDVVEASAAPEPDADVTYSYDASHGPRKGSQVLGAALAKAVDKFETKQTEKLVKDEYDVVDDKEEEVLGRNVAVEDDFELL